MKRSYRQKQSIFNMAGEKLLTILERDVSLALLIQIPGLLYSNNGSRGFPVTWLMPQGENGPKFLLSLIITFALVLIMDIAASAAKSIREPSLDRRDTGTDVTVNSYSGSPTSFSPHASSSSEPRRPAARPSSAAGKTSRASTRPSAATHTFRPLIGEERKPAKKNPTFAAVIAIICAFIGLAASIFNGGDDIITYDDDWDSDYYEDESYSDPYVNTWSIVKYISEQDIDSLLYNVSYEGITEKDWNDIIEYILDRSDIGSLYVYSELYNEYASDSSESIETIIAADDEDNYYVMSFHFAEAEEAYPDDPAPVLTGVVICEDPFCEDGDYSGMNDDEIDAALDYYRDNAFSIGDTDMEGESILRPELYIQ